MTDREAAKQIDRQTNRGLIDGEQMTDEQRTQR